MNLVLGCDDSGKEVYRGTRQECFMWPVSDYIEAALKYYGAKVVVCQEDFSPG